MARMPDSLVGRTIADRYEVVEKINAGGMGAVYRAIQRSLDRQVAIKFIHPHLLSSESSVHRFMDEARLMSRLSHPNVVSVFDFGRTPEVQGDLMYLVMEYLTGPDLADVLQAEPLLPLPRVVSIVLQTLEGLAEAHELGITHRDVKPDNIILEPRRGGRDHVKLIDFGIARADTGRRITETGMVCGTPQYMAPEQIAGVAGPSADLYSVGVMMFRMLTGEFPAGTVGFTWQTPRDPRDVVPDRGIPDALAEVCLQALEFEPRRRFEDASAFEEAIREAMTGSGVGRSWDPHASLSSRPPPHTSSRPPAAPSARPSSPGMLGPATTHVSDRRQPVSETLPARPRGTPPAPAKARWRSPSEARPVLSGAGRHGWTAHGEGAGSIAPPSEEHAPSVPQLLGRAEELAWAEEMLAADAAPTVIAFWGRAGVGRTRLAQEVSSIAQERGALVVPVALDAPPYSELGYRGLRQIVLNLSARSPAELLEDQAADRWAQAGLHLLFSRSHAPTYATTTRHAAAAALGWAMWCATVRSEHGRVLLVLDDLDRLDGASLLALQDYLRGEPVPGVTALVTSEHAKTVLLHGARERALRGLSRSDAVRLLGSLRADAVLTRVDDDVEPLYVEEAAAASPAETYVLPQSLEELVEWHAQALDPLQHRILHAVSIMGACDVEGLAAALRFPGDLRESLDPLVSRGWVVARGKHIALRHALYGRVIVAGAPASTTAALHRAAASQLRNSRELVELRAFHAIHGEPDFEAFLLLEEVARVRAARGDNDGAIAALSTGVNAGRLQRLRGETEAASAALGVFGRKLATALVGGGRLEEAQGVLDEILDAADPRDPTRAAVLDQLATIAEMRGRAEDMERYRRQALQIAERSGDQRLVQRLRASLAAGQAPRPKTAEVQAPGAPAPPVGLAAERPRQPVLVVEDDASIREAIQSVLHGEGHQVYTAVNGRDALEVLHRIPKPGLILLDLMMPVMNGWELLESLRADDELGRIPVVVVSAVTDRREVTASRVLRKPIEVGTLLRVVEEYGC